MLSFYTFLMENKKTSRLIHHTNGEWNKDARVFVDSHIKDSEKTWLTTNTHAVSLTVDLNQKEKSARFNHIQSHISRKGYAQETGRHALSKLKEHGFQIGRAS